MKKSWRKIIKLILGLILISVIFLFGFLLGEKRGLKGLFIDKEFTQTYEELKDINFDIFWQTYTILKEENLYSNKIDLEKVVLWATKGLASSIEDPYTTLFLPVEKENFWQGIKGEFGGIGVHVELIDEVLTVVSVIKGGPASKNGFQAGDEIVAVNGENIIGLDINTSISKIKGEEGTDVNLTIYRKPKTFDLTITRAIINIPTLEVVIEDDIHIIKLQSFNSKSSNLFREAMNDFILKHEKNPKKYNKLIVDLRNNPGGELRAAVNISSWFIPKGNKVLIEEFKGKKTEIYESFGFNAFSSADFSLVVLINRGSASASEIFAGAIQDYAYGILVGEKSFGKGTVQKARNIGDALLKYTIAEWKTPKGRSINKIGIEPDILIKDNPETKIDEQLEKAKLILINQ